MWLLLDVSDNVKKELGKITPTNYIGIARLLVESQLYSKTIASNIK